MNSSIRSITNIGERQRNEFLLHSYIRLTSEELQFVADTVSLTSVTPLHRGDPPKIIFESAQVKVAQQEPVRMASSGTPSATKVSYAALKKKQELFQRPGDTPVYLKGGPADKVLFGVTLALLAYGLGEAVYSVYRLINPKKG